MTAIAHYVLVTLALAFVATPASADDEVAAFYRGVGQILRACHLSTLGHSDEAETIMLDGYDNHVVCNGGALFYSFMAWQHTG